MPAEFRPVETPTKRFCICVTLFVLLLNSLTAMAQDAEKVWKEIIKPCTISELQGKKVVFLGLSNNVEVGTLLRPRREQGGYGMDELVMARVIESLGPNSQVRSVLLQRTSDGKPVWYMVSRAFRVEGLKVRIDFKRKVDTGFKAKYQGPLAGAGVGESGGGLNAAWVNDSVLELTATTPFYVAAELSFYSAPNRFESTRKPRPFTAAEVFMPGRVSEERLK